MLFAGTMMAQEGEGELEPRCTQMFLTTQRSYSLPVLPEELVERLTRSFAPGDFSVGSSINVTLWVRALQVSGDPDDKMEIFIDGVQQAERTGAALNTWLGTNWHRWNVEATRPVSAFEVEIRATTRTDAPSKRPTVLLVAAVEVSDETPSALPSIADSLELFEYESELETPLFAMPGIVRRADAGLAPYPTDWSADQEWVARFGGLREPRIAVSLRGDLDSGTERVQLHYGNHSFGDIPSTASCARHTKDIPMHLWNSPDLRPKVYVQIDPVATGSRLVVDDFTLTYITEKLEQDYPAFAAMFNIIENGDFETGAYPFTIESATGQTNCPPISRIIKTIADACRGDGAAVFERAVLGGATIHYCTAVPEIVGKDQVGEVIIGGVNLSTITEVLLIPEYYAGEPLANGFFVSLPPGAIGRTGDIEEMRVRYRFSGPFNGAVNGQSICTDGRAAFAYLSEGNDEPAPMADCMPLIDTVPPVLEIIDGPGTFPAIHDATTAVSPFISVSRIGPTDPIAFPMTWVPGLPGLNTPKNGMHYSRGDIHIYANPGSRRDVVFRAATIPIPDAMNVDLSAQFYDPRPGEIEGTPFNVEVSGFAGAPSTNPGTPFSYPDTGRGYARWNGTGPSSATSNATTYTTLNSYQSINGRHLFRPVINRNRVTWDATTGHQGEPTSLRFRLEASDRASNRLDASRYNTINIHWIWRARARFTTHMDATIAAPNLSWTLDAPGGTLPEIRPACAPLARFRLWRVGDGGALNMLGMSDWQPGPLRDTRFFNGVSLRELLQTHRGQRLCIDIIGADEAGNVQYDPVGLSASSSLEYLSSESIDYTIWDNASSLQDNLAIDTALRVELFHERYSDAGTEHEIIRNYGTATRVPLPPLAEACDTRVNATVIMRAITPTAAAVDSAYILWKFYKDGVPVAEGRARETYIEAQLINMLILQNLPPDFWAGPPRSMPASLGLEPCMTDLGDFDRHRLGDEGTPPDPVNPNLTSARRREIKYTLTAQTVAIVKGVETVDPTPASASFSIYVREVDDLIREEAPIREFVR